MKAPCRRILSGAARIRMVLMLSLLLAGGLLLSACNMPAQPTVEGGVGYIQTYAAQTVAVRLTEQAFVTPEPTVETPVPPTTAPTTAPATAPVESPTPEPASPTAPAPTTAGTPAASACDQARFVADVSIPDGTTLNPGQSFNKTWRLRNSGTCDWTMGYSIVFSSGDAMGAPASVGIPKNVPAGQTVDVTVAMVAPQEVGSYRGEWRLRNEQGVIFGLGDQAKPFWIEINVAARRGTMLDFYIQANTAQWFTGTGGTANTSLEFGGAIDSEAGSANVMENAPIETGAAAEMVLLTIPRRVTDGIITGIYPPYTVSAGDRFKTSIGLLIPSGDCGEGSVTYRIGYREEGSSIVYLRDINKACDGQMTAVDIDLSSLSTKTVRFVLTVDSRGPFSEDYAAWDKPRIER